MKDQDLASSAVHTATSVPSHDGVIRDSGEGHRDDDDDHDGIKQAAQEIIRPVVNTTPTPPSTETIKIIHMPSVGSFLVAKDDEKETKGKNICFRSGDITTVDPDVLSDETCHMNDSEAPIPTDGDIEEKFESGKFKMKENEFEEGVALLSAAVEMKCVRLVSLKDAHVVRHKLVQIDNSIPGDFLLIASIISSVLMLLKL